MEDISLPKLSHLPERKQSISLNSKNPQSLKDLGAGREQTIAEIERRDRMPIHVRAQFSNALEQRLAAQDRAIAEAEALMIAERMDRLDNELKQRDFTYLTAVRGNIRIKVCVQRRKRGDFLAAAYFDRRMHWDVAETPSSAFKRLQKQMIWSFDRCNATG
jgi:hypothetical protein